MTHFTDSNELIDILTNEQAFYQDWLTLAQNCIPSFFSIRDGEVKFANRYNFLSFSTKEIVSARINDMIRKHLNTTLANLSLKLTGAAVIETKEHFLDKITHQVQSGEMTLPQDLLNQLAVIHAPNTSVAHACRTLGLSRYAVNKLTERYTADIYRRYMELQAGKRYEHVMGDCSPYLHNQPQFTPITLLEKDDPRVKDWIVEGAYVAPQGSSCFQKVDQLACSGNMVYTTSGIVSFPLRVLPVAYKDLAHRLCWAIEPDRQKTHRSA